MNAISPEVVSILLAKGFSDIFQGVVGEGLTIQQDKSLPPSARRALALLSRLSLEESHGEDLGANIHDAMERACTPFMKWGLSSFEPPFGYAEVSLINRDLGVPTEECNELASQAGSEVSIMEELHHEQLRQALETYPQRQRGRAYTEIRGFIVRNPVVAYADLQLFISEGGHAAIANVIQSFYRGLPAAALHGEVARLCGWCGSLLWPERDQQSFPFGRCRLSQCRLEHPHPALGREVDAPSAWRTATPSILQYWVGPGLDEVRIYDSLKSAGREAVLYPQSDAADVGLDGLQVGIDVKTYASPVLLAHKLSRSIGQLGLFRRKIIAVPDRRLSLNSHYLDHLRETYRGAADLEFATVSDVIEEFSR